MASSQVVEFGSPFGCVLRDHNRRDHHHVHRHHRYPSGGDTTRDSSNATRAAHHAAFEKNLKELVRDHLSTCISISSTADSDHHTDPQHLDDHRWPENNHPQLHRCFSSKKVREEKVVEPEPEPEPAPPLMSPNQARILDRWAAQQAREMMTTIEKQGNEEELLALSNSHTVSARTSTLFMREREPSPSQHSDTSSVEIPKLGASTLVQRWRDFEAEARFKRSSSVSSNSGGGASAPARIPDSALGEPEPGPEQELERSHSGGSEVDDGFNSCGNKRGRGEEREEEEEEPMPSKSGDEESEKIRVADIIRRLTTTCSTPRRTSLSSSYSEENDHDSVAVLPKERLLAPIVVNSPKRIIRGRQAFTDFLLQMERERQQELQALSDRRAVSKFPQKGRIQSMLRLRFLHRGPVLHKEHRTTLHHSSPSWDQLRERSAITLLREKFSIGVPDSARAGTVGSPHIEELSKRLASDGLHDKFMREEGSGGKEQSFPEVQKSVMMYGPEVQIQQIECSKPCAPEVQMQHSVSYTAEVMQHSEKYAPEFMQHSEEGAPEEVHEDSTPNSDLTHQCTISNTSCDESVGSPNGATYFNSWEVNVITEEDGGDEQYVGTSYDWFSDISRPQKDWEDRRQERYQEMLEASDDEDIKQLLQRKTVSSFLSSDLRDTMDQLMASFVQKKIYHVDSQGGGEQGKGRGGGGEGKDSGEACIQSEKEVNVEVEVKVELEEQDDDEDDDEQGKEEEAEVEEDEDEEDYDDEEEQSPRGHQYYDMGEYYDQTSPSIQTPSPSHSRRPWTQYNNHESGGSDRVFSTFSSRASPSQFYSHDSEPCSCCRNHPSIETELIYDLTRHIEQLHHEMAELQKTVKDCMQKQNGSQHSKQKASIHLGNNGKRMGYRASSKGKCCICYERQVDSLLYRCGHMCTCLKCAHELERSSGTCPKCEAPILDVVRAFAE